MASIFSNVLRTANLLHKFRGHRDWITRLFCGWFLAGLRVINADIITLETMQNIYCNSFLPFSLFFSLSLFFSQFHLHEPVVCYRLAFVERTIGLIYFCSLIILLLLVWVVFALRPPGRLFHCARV